MTKNFLWLKNCDQIIKKNCDQIKKNKKNVTKKKIVTKLEKKTLQESQKAALRVGRLSRCWGDKKNCDKTRKLKLCRKKPWKLKLWQNSRTQIVTKLKNWNWDQTQNFLICQNLKTQILTKLKKKIVTKLKTQSVTKLKNLNCDKTWKLKLWQN